MGDIPCLFSDTTTSVRRTQSIEHYGQYTHGHGGNPLKILGAETYLDGNTLAIAHSLAELAQQPAHDMAMGWTVRYDDNGETSGTTTPPILKARQADDDLNRFSERRMSSAEEAKENLKERSVDTEEKQAGKKKRKRRTSEDENGGNEAEKKARGRPRLDTQDESAADRRRTQIRMAQRAYRNRKETTITSLEKQVEKLQSMTEEMNSAFIGLYDLAMNKGLLQKDPEFGQQFQSATQRFLDLAKSIGGDESATQDDGLSTQANALALRMERSTAIAGNQRQDSHPNRHLPPEELTRTLTTNSVWGYEISHSAPAVDTSYTTQRFFEQLPNPTPPVSSNHEVVARATEQNASFPFDMYHNDELPSTSTVQTDYQGNFTTVPENSTLFSSSHLSSFNPWAQPAPSASYAHGEVSFGRRLHRTIIERGYKLLLNPHLNKKVFDRVFGLTLKLYPHEMLQEALRRVIMANKNEPLSQWNLPFINLGGSGTYFPPAEEEQTARTGTGRSVGPMTEIISENMEKYLLDNYRGNVPGYEGMWFDTYDVEAYLAKRGIYIPPNVEWITVDLDKINLADVAVTGHMVAPSNSSSLTSTGTTATSSLTSTGTTATPPSPQTPYINELGERQRVQTVDTSLEFFVEGLGNTYTSDSYTAPLVAESSQNLGPNWHGETLYSGPPISTKFDVNRIESKTVASSDTQRLVTFNVTTLIEAILRKGICLGRAPGFRPSDIDKALRRTIQNAELR